VTEEERLFAEVEKLKVKAGDIILIKAARVDDETVKGLRPIAEALSKTFDCLVILVGPDDCVTDMDEDVMDSYGWVRKAEL